MFTTLAQPDDDDERHPLTGLPLDPYAPDKESPFGVAPLGDELKTIEEDTDFWNATPQLQLIANVSDKRGVSRWAVLGVVIGNALSYLPPRFVLSDRNGFCAGLNDAASLNSYFHIIGESNDGKSLVTGVGNILLPPKVNSSAVGAGDEGDGDPEPDALTAGTGEGLLKHFVHMGTITTTDDKGQEVSKKGMVQVADTAVTTIDEAVTYVAELARTTSKAAGILVSVWSGMTTGAQTGGAESRTKLSRHAARLIVFMLGQYGHVTELFTDQQVDMGAPHRAVWLPAVNYTNTPVGTSSLRLLQDPETTWNALMQAQHGPNTVGYALRTDSFPRFVKSPSDSDLYWIHAPLAAKRFMAIEDGQKDKRKLSPAAVAKMTPEEAKARRAEKLTGHATLTRLKVMVGLALIHGRIQPSDLDWELSGVVSRVSLGMLAACLKVAQRTREEQAHNKGVERAHELEATADERDRRDALFEKLLGDDVVRRLFTVKYPMGKTEIMHVKPRMSDKKCKALAGVLETLLDSGAITYIEKDKGYRPTYLGRTVMDDENDAEFYAEQAGS